MIDEGRVRDVLSGVIGSGGLWADGVAVWVQGALAGARRSGCALAPDDVCTWAQDAGWPADEVQVLRGVAAYALLSGHDIGQITMVGSGEGRLLRLTADEWHLSTQALFQILGGMLGELTAAECLAATGATRRAVGELLDRLRGRAPREWEAESSHRLRVDRLRAERAAAGEISPPAEDSREDDRERTEWWMRFSFRSALRQGGFASPDAVGLLHAVMPKLDDPDPLVSAEDVEAMILDAGWSSEDLPTLRGIALAHTNETAAAEQLLAVPAVDTSLRRSLTEPDARIVAGALRSIHAGPRRIRDSEFHTVTGYNPYEAGVLVAALNTALADQQT